KASDQPAPPEAEAVAPITSGPPLTPGHPPLGPGSTGYYRTPTIRGDVVVFAAEGDLWQVARTGGVATRLTSHLGNEWSPAISADRTVLAFSASYEGPTEVYTMPAAGGTPVRRTFDGDARVVGFAPDGTLLYASGKYSTLPDVRLFRLDIKTDQRTPVPLSEASDGCFTEDGRTLYFTRLPFQGSHTKHYRGGTAQTLWKYVTGAPEAVPLTADYPGTSKTPMCWQGRVYFLSDRDGTMNVWSMDADGHDLRQHTRNVDWDADQASLGDGQIVYHLGADIHLYDIASDKDRALDITLSSDFDQERETWVKKPMDYLSSIALSPKGDRVALTARGQVFVAPAKQGRLVELTRDPNVRYRRATFMPDGKSVVALSDQSGEVELWTLPANGVGKAEELTKGGTIMRWEAVPSPDGAWIAHTDKEHRLWIWNVDKKSDRLVVTSKAGDADDLAWSGDGQWLAYATDAPNHMSQIFLCNPADGATTAVTTDRFDSFSPAWSPDGAWLYFLSDRDLRSAVRSPWGPRQPDPYIVDPTQIFALALRKDVRFPFAPADELHPQEAAREAEKKASPKRPHTTRGPADVELDGIAERLYRVPVPSGRYGALRTDGQRLYWLASEPSIEPKHKLFVLPIDREDPKPKVLLEDVREYRVSADDKKLLVRKGKDKDPGDLYVFDAGDKAPEKLDEAKVDLGGWSFSFDPREQWRQMYLEAWRLERDYFYDRGMNGADWPKIRDKYLPLVDRVRSRDDLNDLIGQMVSELSALHIFVAGGDSRHGTDDVEVSSLGAELTKDAKAGGLRVTRIYTADPDDPGGLSPLRRNGAGVEVGDVIRSINGVPTLSVVDAAALLRNQAGRQVLLEVEPKKPKDKAAPATRQVIVVPISRRDARNLRYADWEYDRRRRVDDEGKGAIGYVHLPAMGGDDYAQWARDFYPVFQRQGLIIDVRHNSGGNIDSWILGKLLRKPWSYWQDRVSDPRWNMQYAFRGHIAVLVDAWTASDGEAFAEGIKRLKLGEVIGERTWGGEIWLSFDNPLVDKGIATAAENGLYGPEGQWLIEGHGVDPDIVVDDLPRATFDGKDEQLERAITYLEEKIAAEPIKDVPPPAFPRK
ncbi:MAG TPA: S41 family peptidase, partial [Polyangiaceae bacterium]